MAIQFVKLKVEGMSCSHCENAVKKAVTGLNGVSHVDVSLDDKTVSVEYDPEKTSEDEIARAIDEQGYEVK